MDDREFQDAIRKLKADNARVIDSIARMPPLTEEQKRVVEEMLVSQKQEYDEYIKSCAETKPQGQLVKEAWNAARRAAQDGDPKYASQSGSWRAMWVALAVVGALLLLVKALFR